MLAVTKPNVVFKRISLRPRDVLVNGKVGLRVKIKELPQGGFAGEVPALQVRKFRTRKPGLVQKVALGFALAREIRNDRQPAPAIVAHCRAQSFEASGMDASFRRRMQDPDNLQLANPVP